MSDLVEYLPILNVLLNVLIIPAMAMLWSVRVEQARIDAKFSATMEGFDKRLANLEFSKK